MSENIFSEYDEPIMSISLMFALTQILGLAAGILLITGSIHDTNVNYLSISPSGNPNDASNAGFMMLYVLVGAGAALLVIKYIRTNILFRFLEFAIVGGSVSVFCFAFIFAFSGLDFSSSIIAAFVLGASFALLKFFISSLKNAAAILSSAGVAALFGFSLGFWPAILFVLALALYDYLAVFKTKHMLVLAQGLGTKDMSFTITAQSKKYQMHEKLDNASKKFQALHISKPDSNVSRLDLGSGDLAIPAMLAVSSYTVAGLAGSIAIILGSIITMYFTLNFVVKKQVVLPALPPICLGGMLGLIIVTLVRMAGIGI